MNSFNISEMYNSLQYLLILNNKIVFIKYLFLLFNSTKKIYNDIISVLIV